MHYLTGMALDQVFARYDGTNTGWYLSDNLGSIRLLVTTAGTILDQLTYDSYGNNLTETSPASGDRFKYTAREWDAEIGQYYYRARNYSPFDGRFTSQDPLGFAGRDMDLYRYVSNSPTILVDPTGLDRTVCHFVHCWIRVDAYDNAGNNNGYVYLHFSPSGYEVLGTPVYPEWFCFSTIRSTPAQDQQLVELWRELEKQLMKDGWRQPALQWGPVTNCWLPVLLLHHFPDVPVPQRPELSGESWLQKYRGK
jgi:RHS repeat-associated protein